MIMVIAQIKGQSLGSGSPAARAAITRRYPIHLFLRIDAITQNHCRGSDLCLCYARYVTKRLCHGII